MTCNRITRKRELSLMLAIIMIMTLIPMTATADEHEATIPEEGITFQAGKSGFWDHGQWTSTDVPAFIENNRLMVPVAHASRALGIDVEWEAETQTVLVKSDEDLITLNIDSPYILKNGELLMTMDTNAVIQNIGGGLGRTMLPVSRLARALDVDYTWEEDNGIVTFHPEEEQEEQEAEEGPIIFDEPGTFGPENEEETDTIDNDVIIQVDGVTLQNITITGTLTIAEEVGEGDVTLNNIIVEDDTYIRGGGADSIYINDGNFSNIIIQKTGGGLRIVMVGDRGAVIMLSEETEEAEVILEGNYEKVIVLGSDITLVTRGETTIDELDIHNTAKNFTLKTSSDTSVEKAVIDTESATFEGSQSTVKTAEGRYRSQLLDRNEVVASEPAGGGGGGSSSSPPKEEPAPLPTMTANPTEVTTDSDFNQTFTLTIENDTVVNAVYAKDISLDGVFQEMQVGAVARSNNTTVTAAVYGNLADPGLGKITLYADALVDSKSSLEADITVVEATAVQVSAVTVTGEGDTTTITTDAGTLQMIATVTPTNASNKEVNWSVTPGTGLATIDSNGLLTAVANGTVIVVATAQDGSGVIGSHQITISGQSAVVVKSSSDLWNALDNVNISTIVFGNDIEYQGLGGSTSTHALVNGQTIDGNGFTLTIGQLNINADNVTIKDLTVIGNVAIASGVNNFTAQGTNFDHLTIISGGFASGSGTFDDPWIIETAEQLNNVRNYLGTGNQNKYFELANDIDLGQYPWNEGEGWEPVGEGMTAFTGKFDGKNHSIKNLYINRSSESQGLFGKVSGATIKNIRLLDVEIEGGSRTGGLVGFSSHSNFEEILVSGTINGSSLTGGIVGNAQYGGITRAHSSVDVNGGYGTGGVIGYGYMGDFTITNSSSTGDISGTYYVGGIAGQLDGIIEQSFSSGNIYSEGGVSTGSAGGLVGNGGNIKNSYSVANVSSGSTRVGGLVGDGGRITNSYAVGEVSGTSDVGGLMGWWPISGIYVENSYWNTETTKQNASTAGGDGKTTAEMLNSATYDGWDFAGIWSIKEGESYPYLKWQGDDNIPYPPAQKFAISANVTGGTADVTTNPANEAAAGETITITIENIQSGHEFSEVYVNAGDVPVSVITPDSVFEFEMPTEDAHILVVVTSEVVIDAPQGEMVEIFSGNNVAGILYEFSGRLYYSAYEYSSSSWVMHEEVATATIGTMALDTDDIPHITFVNSDNSLSYVKWNSGAWTAPVNIDETSFITKPHMAIDGNTVHVTYTRPGESSTPGNPADYENIMYASSTDGLSFDKEEVFNGHETDNSVPREVFIYLKGSKIATSSIGTLLGVHEYYLDNPAPIGINWTFTHRDSAIFRTLDNSLNFIESEEVAIPSGDNPNKVDVLDMITHNGNAYALYRVEDYRMARLIDDDGLTFEGEVNGINVPLHRLAVSDSLMIASGKDGGNPYVNMNGIGRTYSQNAGGGIVGITQNAGNFYLFYYDVNSEQVELMLVDPPG